jgi:hypothetical protein
MLAGVCQLWCLGRAFARSLTDWERQLHSLESVSPSYVNCLYSFRLTMVLVANVSHADQAVGTACGYLFKSLGSVFGVSMAATALNQMLRRSLRIALKGEQDAEKIAERLRAGLLYLDTLDPQTKEVV